MKRFYFIIGLCYTLIAKAQLPTYNSAIIWRGFEHKWTYNHRCNRIGDYVVYNHGKPQTTHVSATGLGADSTYFTSAYTKITSPNLFFKEGKTTLKIETTEKQLSEGEILVTIPCDDWLQNKDRYVTTLNGFDLHSEQAADKIQLMRLNVSDPVYSDSSKELLLKVNFSVVLNCQSAECPELDKHVSYNLDVYFLIAGYNNPDAHVAEDFFTRSYSWDRKEELNEMPRLHSICGVLIDTMPNAVLGIKSFSLVLNEAHWLLEFSNLISPLSYNSAKGCYNLSLNLLFKEWQEGMKTNSASPRQSEFSAKRKGWVVMDMDVVLLQFIEGNIIDGSRQGKMFWGGGNQNPLKNGAVSTKYVE